MDHLFFSMQSKNGSIASMACIRTDDAGVTRAQWSDSVTDARPFKDTLAAMVREVIESHDKSRFVVVVHDIGTMQADFDKACNDHAVSNPFTGRSWIDTKHLAWPFAFNGRLGRRDLGSVAAHFGIDAGTPSDPASEAMVCRSVYWAMMKRYRMMVSAEDKIREVGASAISSVLGMFTGE
jgi:hypothetical protein